MSFDTSRFSFHPWNDYLGVIMQQGRVQLDADWNEWVAQLNRRMQVQTLDTMDRAVVPRTTPSGFEILASGMNLTIGVGRMYVDGLLVENHGAAPVSWSKELAEQAGTVSIPFYEQPYLPFNHPDESGAAAVFNRPTLHSGNYLVYLDVWQREVTHLQDEELIEKAVGIDTTGRLQTVWQVKVLDNIGSFDCVSPDSELETWQALIRPSGGRLNSTTGKVSGEFNPCLMAPTAGYAGLENQLYRVEIHQGGVQANESGTSKATFKWSRDNGTVAARVLVIENNKVLIVDSLGRDESLSFHAGDWIEILDDWHELHNLPGRLHRIEPGSGVDSARCAITLEVPLPTGLFPVSKKNVPLARNTRIRRWDQPNIVKKANGTVYYDASSSGTTAGIPVPPPGTQLLLENNILVDFDREGQGLFHVADHWVFTARSADGSIEELVQEPPRGIHHHYARLALVTLPGKEWSCRTLWPPETVGESCDCTVCVDAKGHNSGAATIQQAIDTIREQGGGTICLNVGTYLLREPLELQSVRSLRLRGQGWRTILRRTEAGRALSLNRVTGVTLENFSVTGITGQKGVSSLISVNNCAGLQCTGLTLASAAEGSAVSVAIDLTGVILGASFSDCIFVADHGINTIPGKGNYLLGAELTVTNNVFLCSAGGIGFRGACLHYGQTRLADNLVLKCGQFGIGLTGGALPHSSIAVVNNSIHVTGTGILGGIDGLRIDGNDITAMSGRARRDGILLQRDSGLFANLPLDAIRLSGNIIRGQRGNGISVEQTLGDATVESNRVEEVGGGGLVMAPGTSADSLRITGNRFVKLGQGYNTEDVPFFGLSLMAVRRADVANNTFGEIGVRAESTRILGSVAVLAGREIRIDGNRFYEVGPEEFIGRTTALLLAPGLGEGVLCDNSIVREISAKDVKPSDWQALLVYGSAKSLQDKEAANLFDYLPALACLPLGSSDCIYLEEAQIMLIEDLPKLAVRANTVRSRYSRMLCSQILGVESCLFQGNDIEVAYGGTTQGNMAGEITCVHGSVSNNRFVTPEVKSSFALQVQEKKYSVIGNLRSFPIRINGDDDASLPPPLNSMNVTI